MILVVSILFSVLEKGAGVVQSTYGISSNCAAVLQGIILFFILGCEFFVRYTVVPAPGRGAAGMLLKFLVAAIAAGTPLLFGTVGEILNERVGHLNLGVEGMMAIGACAGFMAGYLTDSFAAALIAAFLAGMLAALIYAVLTVTFLANQNVTGLALTIFGEGLSNFIGVLMISRSETKTLKLPETITAHMRSVSIPGLSDLPAAGELFFSYNPFVYLGIVIALAAGYYLHRTQTGLNVRAVGENPAAARRRRNQRHPDKVCQHPARRRYLRHRRGILLDDHQLRRLDFGQRGRPRLDRRRAGYLRGVEAGRRDCRLLPVRRASGAQVLCAEGGHRNPDRFL